MNGRERILARIAGRLANLLPLERPDRQRAADDGWQFEKITAEIELPRLAVREDRR